MTKIKKEKQTIQIMIQFYCRKKHGNKNLCQQCEELKQYALTRLEKCSFGDDKPACKDCKIHCYNPHKRYQIRQVMRFSAPRMLIYYPFEFIRHYLSK